MGIFKKLKRRYEEEYELENLENFVYDDLEDSQIEKVSKQLDEVNISQYDKGDILTYIEAQCDIMEEASKHIDNAKEEYAAVTSYFSDIQLIETAPELLKEEISSVASTVADLTVDRRIFRSTENKLSTNAYARMERIEPDMPRVLINLQNDESYFEAVKKDMRMLEGERASLRYDANDLTKRQIAIKSISTYAIIGLCIVFMVFIAASFMIEDSNPMFIIVTFLAAFLAVGLFTILKATERRVLLTEIKLNKATNLLNKVKIKYINSANTLDYAYSKYGVKSSYEFSRQYEMYLEMKSERHKVSQMTSQLNEAEVTLTALLKKLHLYDSQIWLAQVKALVDPKEMVEVRHELTQKRQKLRTQIEYNQNRIDDAKQSVKRVTINNPEYKQRVLEIIEHYERRNK